MDYTKLKDEISEISKIAQGVPDEFRSKCFEILLTRLVEAESKVASSSKHSARAAGARDGGGETPPDGSDANTTNAAGKADREALPIQAQVRVWMQRTGVTREELDAVLMYAEGDVHFIKEPHGIKVAVGQLQWALLLALRNGILHNNMSIDAEAVRSICQEKGFYDTANFAANFKRNAGSVLFRGVLEPQGEAQSLTNEGQGELAKVIRTLAGPPKS